jgi:23S rRNA-/tRNA-specific pseudouridylate synthase
MFQKSILSIYGFQQKNVKKSWFASCEEALNRRKEARLQWINDPSNREKESTYKERQKEANNIFRFEKRKFMKDIL